MMTSYTTQSDDVIMIGPPPLEVKSKKRKEKKSREKPK